MKNIRRSKALSVWFKIMVVLFVFMLVVTILLTQNTSLYNTVNSMLGGEERYLKSGDPDDYQYYRADYTSKSEVLAAANAFNEEICEEGITLLKNENNALPLDYGQRITVFGKNSVNLVLGGSGSNAGSGSNVKADLFGSLRNAGFVCNPVLEAFYKSAQSGSVRSESPGMGEEVTGFPIGETPVSFYTQAVRDSYKDYGEAALVVISRIGGEGYDLPRSMYWDGFRYTNWSGTETIPGARSKDDHYLQLDQNETDMIDEACKYFSKVIVLINSSSTLELGFLDDPTHYAYNGKILAALWIGHPGKSGINALGRVLNGMVNPSGRTVDTYVRNFKNDPTWENFGNNLLKDSNRYMSDGAARNAYFVEYREGIYVGYRYYETKAFYEDAIWYKNNVVYPFGYGKSYTEFSYSATPALKDGAMLTSDGKLSFSVDITNIGMDYDGKEVVQLYYTAPYTAGGIEKAYVVLGDFEKTELISKRNGVESVTLEMDVRDLASYDYSDANKNGFKGYEVEEGEYTFYITNNAHGWADDNVIKYTYIVPVGGFTYETDEATDEPIVNLFDDVSGHIQEYLSRKDGFANYDALEGASENSYRNMSDEFFSALTYQYGDKTSDPWYTEKMPTQSKRELSYKETEVKLFELIGKDYDDELWEKLLDQLTVSQMVKIIGTGNFRSLQIENIDKPLTIDADGPMGFSLFMGDSSVYDTCYYASECVLGATWNKDLAYRMGKMIGNEGLIGNEKGGGGPYSGWYAPAINIHRNQFGGRNFEYYSEDGLLSGVLATSVVRGANEKGVYTFVKHFALNEQETDRDTTGLITWANEQSMRELYFQPFEMCVKDGGTTAMMSSFNRIGTTWTGGNYALLTSLLRKEWGFKGMVISDYNTHTYMDTDQMIRAGGDLNLCAGKTPKNVTSTTDVASIRHAVKNILYTVANSNAMNGFGPNVIWGYTMPWWTIWLIIVNVLVFSTAVGLAVIIYREKNNDKKDKVA